MNLRRILGGVFVALLLVATSATAGTFDLEKDFSKAIKSGEKLLQKIEKKQTEGKSADSELKALQKLRDRLLAGHLILQERFKNNAQKAGQIGGEILVRQLEMADRYDELIGRYIKQLEILADDEDLSPAVIKELLELSEKIAPPRQRSSDPRFAPLSACQFCRTSPTDDPGRDPGVPGSDGDNHLCRY